MPEPDVLITGERSKLPPDIAALLDPANPIPADVVFFEKRFNFREMTRRLLIGGGLAVAALIVIPFGVYAIFHPGPAAVYSQVDFWPLGVGLLVALCAWIMFASVKTCYELRREQSAGRSTRRGLFLLPGTLVLNEVSDTTVIPATRFLGYDPASIKYCHKETDKSAKLPSPLLVATREQMLDSIERWVIAFGTPTSGEAAQTGTNLSPPPFPEDLKR